MMWWLLARVVAGEELREWCEAGGGGLGRGVAIGTRAEAIAPRGLFAAAFGQEARLRGLVVTEDLEPEAVVLGVPLTLAMHSNDWPRSFLGRRCRRGRRLEELTNEYLLGAMLAVESHVPRSPWKPYLDALSLVDAPRLWEPEDAELLPPTLRKRYENQRKHDERAHRVILDHCSLHSPRLESLRWAVALAASRSRRVKVYAAGGDLSYLRMLIPLADLLNWSPEPNVHCDTTTDNVYECRAARAVRAGEALTVAYENTQPADFLFDYGFVPSQLTDCDLAATRPDPAAAYAGLKADIAEVKRKLAHQGHHESRGELILTVLYHRRRCLRDRHPDLPDHDDDQSSREL
mmetsp:Transcript_2571/g.8003  ORF Transcript_2571/g.8003 Transcript_2571/m.8003 type:complete len:348 (+) Transcript_2571:272-1315(+)